MNTNEAKERLFLYRGPMDDEDPQFKEALAHANSLTTPRRLLQSEERKLCATGSCGSSQRDSEILTAIAKADLPRSLADNVSHHFCSMRISEDLRKFVAEPKISGNEN